MFILHKPLSHIRDVAVKTPLAFSENGSLQSARLAVSVDVEVGDRGSARDIECRATLYRQDREALVTGKRELSEVFVEPVTLSVGCEGPLWAARDATSARDRDRRAVRFSVGWPCIMVAHCDRQLMCVRLQSSNSGPCCTAPDSRSCGRSSKTWGPSASCGRLRSPSCTCWSSS